MKKDSWEPNKMPDWWQESEQFFSRLPAEFVCIDTTDPGLDIEIYEEAVKEIEQLLAHPNNL